MDFEKEYEIWKPIFNTLFNTKREVLIDVVKRMVAHDKNASEVFSDNNVKIYKTLVDDEPKELTIVSWSKIDITPFGIYHQPEHGLNQKIVVFNEFFKLNL